VKRTGRIPVVVLEANVRVCQHGLMLAACVTGAQPTHHYQPQPPISVSQWGIRNEREFSESPHRQ
jgi:hypothetical protein